jgi:hypothetical protein
MAGFRCVKNLCNMDPMLFYQPFIYYSLLLIEHFGLTFPETVGLVSAIEVLPNTAYWFCVTAEALLGTKASNLDTEQAVIVSCLEFRCFLFCCSGASLCSF